jgi:hypothetical protein
LQVCSEVPLQLFWPAEHSGAMQPDAVLTVQSWFVAQTATLVQAVRPALHDCSCVPTQLMSPVLQNGDPQPPAPLVWQDLGRRTRANWACKPSQPVLCQ